MNHDCDGQYKLRLARMVSASLNNDEAMYRVVVDEIGDCLRCWQAAAHWGVCLLAGDRTIAARSQERAAEQVASELARVLMR